MCRNNKGNNEPLVMNEIFEIVRNRSPEIKIGIKGHITLPVLLYDK